jgi:hypothetical protein
MRTSRRRSESQVAGTPCKCGVPAAASVMVGRNPTPGWLFAQVGGWGPWVSPTLMSPVQTRIGG